MFHICSLSPPLKSVRRLFVPLQPVHRVSLFHQNQAKRFVNLLADWGWCSSSFFPVQKSKNNSHLRWRLVWSDRFSQITDHENRPTKYIAEFVYLSCTYIKNFFIGFWWSILPQHFNGYWYFDIFPIGGPHSLKEGDRMVLHWQRPLKHDGLLLKNRLSHLVDSTKRPGTQHFQLL